MYTLRAKKMDKRLRILGHHRSQTWEKKLAVRAEEILREREDVVADLLREKVAKGGEGGEVLVQRQKADLRSRRAPTIQEMGRARRGLHFVGSAETSERRQQRSGLETCFSSTSTRVEGWWRGANSN
ncbi:MAG: hypothetical protein ABDH61_03065 [Acidilobaceae archaeon]